MTQKKERTWTRRRKSNKIKTLSSKRRRKRNKKRHFSTGAHTLTINSFIIKLTSQITKKKKRSCIVRDYKKDLKHLFDVKNEEGTTSKFLFQISFPCLCKRLFLCSILNMSCVCVIACFFKFIKKVILANFLSRTTFFFL